MWRALPSNAANACFRTSGRRRGHNHVSIGKENYFLSVDGYLMPARKDQAPPDLRYFNQARK
jgi:hypothetical protein